MHFHSSARRTTCTQHLGACFKLQSATPFNYSKELGMQHAQQEPIFSSIRKIFAGETPVQKPVAEMRPLTQDELRAVAGGPECEVGSGL
ncbi:hypothetical protein [Massilia sp. Root351]|jgi:hypothetical protein|uniref:hypothetical protein n=1 Tax=Massilia sp. Root351 TaxID=1736522 RepID=UPI0012F62D15|nr:hypothetical protein [Massilia sp. Root351]